MTIKYNDPISRVDSLLVHQVVDSRRRFQREMIRVRKVINEEGFVLVLKNSTRARKVTICNCHDKSVVINFVKTPVLTAHSLAERTKVQREIKLASGREVSNVVPEMREYLYSGDVAPRVDKIVAVDARSKLTDDNVYATLIRSVKLISREADGNDPVYDFVLDTGEVLKDRHCPVDNLAKRIGEEEEFFYIENKAGDYRVSSALFFNWKFQFEV